MTTVRARSWFCARAGGRRRGITMVDTVITVMIIGILAAVATPKFVDAMLYHRTQAAARRIKADLQWSRGRAVSSSRDVLIQFDPASSSYTIPALQDLNRPDKAYQVDLTAYPYSATIVSASCDGDEELSFSRFGSPDSDGTITVQAGKYTQTVTVEASTGRVTIP